LVGTIETGECADPVLVDGDPLDVSGLRGLIHAVYRDGELVDRS
jgi:imidazolonepropionase-like amidohydrolase